MYFENFTINSNIFSDEFLLVDTYI